jgi:hypothetical protein
MDGLRVTAKREVMLKKTYLFQTVNGIFVCFNEFYSGDMFDAFLEFLRKKLAVNISESTRGPYSSLVDFSFGAIDVTAMFHDDTGCCVRVSDRDLNAARQIVAMCYGPS